MITIRDVGDLIETERTLGRPPCVAAAIREGASPGRCRAALDGDIAHGPDRDLGEAAEELRCLSGVLDEFKLSGEEIGFEARFCELCKDSCCLYAQMKNR